MRGHEQQQIADEHQECFKQICEYIGLIVEKGEKITCNEAVNVRSTKRPKFETTPDWKVMDIVSGQWTYVEVTSGMGDCTHKKAQQRVIEHARIEQDRPIPYVIVIGAIIRKLDDLLAAVQSAKNGKESVYFGELKGLLFELFNWEW